MEVFNQLEIVYNLIFASLAGVAIRITLSLVKQKWVRTYHNTVTYTLLPAVAFVITKVISGNIALSLGMIGALSIIRFRNPVRSSLELVIFFALMTIGISFAVNNKLGVLLVIFIIITLFILYFLDSFFKKNNKKSLFQISFDEGDYGNILEISSNEKINIEKNVNLLIYNYSEDEKLHNYKFQFNDRETLDEYKSKIESSYKIKTIDVQYKF